MAIPNPLKIKVGADPELWVYNKPIGEIIRAYPYIKGTKQEPFRVPKGATQVDGMAAEYNIDPALSANEFVDNNLAVLASLKAMLPPFHKLYAFPFYYFSDQLWREATDKEKELGCNPDFDAWTGQQNPMPEEAGHMRTASGHVHVGWTENASVDDPNHIADAREVVKQLDCLLGVQSVRWDSDQGRRRLYGRPGAHRVKPYGVEYRVLSNAWVRNPGCMEFIFDATVKAVTDLYNGVSYPAWFHDNKGSVDYALKSIEGIAGYYPTNCIPLWEDVTQYRNASYEL